MLPEGARRRRGAPVRRRTLAALAVLLFLPAGGIAAAADLTVLAAASLRGPLDEIVAAFAKASGHRVRISFAASSALARQAEAGAPAEVFISADLDWMDYLERRGLIAEGTRANLLANDLVLVAPKASAVTLRIAPNFPIAEALGDGRLAIGQPDSVPAGKYAKAALASLGAWASVEKRVAGAESVRAALALVSRGEAPLGIVYRTDAIADPRVRIVDAFPANTHPPIVYPAAALKGGRLAEAKRLLEHLRSPASRGTWERAGFRPAP
jgi:molybdate transport system substrate-binding protein